MQTGPSNIASRAIADVLTGPQRQAKPRRGGFRLNKIALTVVLLYLLVPLAATLVFGIATGNGIDFSALKSTFSDPDLATTLIVSLELALATTLLAVVLVTPTAYWVHLRLPKARPLLDFLSLIPFAMPAIVLSVGLIEVYNGTNSPIINVLSLGIVPLLASLKIVDTPPLLVCAYVIISLPFVYRPIDNSLRAINTTVLPIVLDAAGGAHFLPSFYRISSPASSVRRCLSSRRSWASLPSPACSVSTPSLFT
jgi:putative spermidine/putrescine transport system permease protein